MPSKIHVNFPVTTIREGQLCHAVWGNRVLSTGGRQGGKLLPPPPPPPKRLASDSTYHSIIRVAFIMSALITQELKFSLFKLSQVIKCLSFCTSHGKGYIPLPHPPPTATLSMMATPPPPPPPNFESWKNTSTCCMHSYKPRI